MTAEVELFQPRPPAMIAAQQAALLASPDDIDSWAVIASDVIKLSRYICETEFVPRNYRGNEYATAAAILAGRELGLPPFTALRHVHLVEGSPSLSAEYKRARVLAAGHELDILELNTTRCRVAGRRHGSGKPPLEITFTIEDAKRAGLVKSRGAWETRPRRMLFARASTEVCDFLFADVTNGLPTTELLEAGDADEFGGYAESPAQATPAPAAEQAKPRTAQRRQRTQTAGAGNRRGEARGEDRGLGADRVEPSGSQRTEPLHSEVPGPGLPPLPGEDEPDPTSAPTAGTSDASTARPGTDEPRATTGQVGIIRKHFDRLGFEEEERDQRLAITATIAAVDPVASTKELTQPQAKAVMDTLARCRDRDALIALLAASDQDSDGEASNG